MSEAKASALKALELDPGLAEAHTSLGFVEMHYEWKWRMAETEFKKAIRLNPSYATAHEWYAFDLAALGQLKDAMAEIGQAQRLDPLSLIINTDVWQLLNYAGEVDAAIQQCRAVLEMEPKFCHARDILGWTYMRKKLYPAAVREFQVCGADGNMWFAADLVTADVISGRQADAHRILAQLIAHSKQNNNISTEIAAAYLALDNRDESLSWLEKAYTERSGLMLLHLDPAWDSLRSDPRFNDLMKRIGLPQ